MSIFAIIEGRLIMKRLIFCFDGTSNEIDKDEPTNVLLLASGIANAHKSVPQIIYYEEGVGNEPGRKLRDGATGKGLYDKIKEAYEFLCFNYVEGDEIFVFGFSRGAYTARSFCGFIHYNGIVKRAKIETVLDANNAYRDRDTTIIEDRDTRLSRYDDRYKTSVNVCCSAEEQYYRAERANKTPGDFPLIKIKYLGVWDTVKTLTYGDGKKDHDFHIDNTVEIIEAARHAIAIDEYRKEFDITLIHNLDDANARVFNHDVDLDITLKQYQISPLRKFQEKWFPGNHGSVGGGGDVRGLSDAAFLWVLEGAKAAGLRVDTSELGRVFDIRPDPRAPLDNTKKDDLMEHLWTVKSELQAHQRSGPRGLHEVAHSTILRVAYSKYDDKTDEIYDPGPLKYVWSDIENEASKYTKSDFDLCVDYADIQVKPGDIRHIGGQDYHTHLIIRGESLRLIAKHWLGNTDQVENIMQANRIMIPDKNTIQAGQIINLPMNGFLREKLSEK